MSEGNWAHLGTCFEVTELITNCNGGKAAEVGFNFTPVRFVLTLEPKHEAAHNKRGTQYKFNNFALGLKKAEQA